MSATNPSGIGDFLRNRRAELRPEQVGLPVANDARRRSRGLRREDVAALAAISTDYYARIEQGRRQAPRATLETIADVLRLDEAGRDYLLELSEAGRSRPARRIGGQVSPQLRRLLEQLPRTPAVVMGSRLQVLAWNPSAAALITDFGAIPPGQRNFVRLMFLEPKMRGLLPEWKNEARLCVAMLHTDVARDPNHPKVAKLVGELSVADTDFRQWWSKHQVVVRTSGTTLFDHPVIGELSLEWSSMTDAGDPSQRFLYWSAPVDSRAYQQLSELESLA